MDKTACDKQTADCKYFDFIFYSSIKSKIIITNAPPPM